MHYNLQVINPGTSLKTKQELPASGTLGNNEWGERDSLNCSVLLGHEIRFQLRGLFVYHCSVFGVHHLEANAPQSPSVSVFVQAVLMTSKRPFILLY